LYDYEEVRDHWNYSETAQVIARGWRLGSHSELIKRGDNKIAVEVYQQVSLPIELKNGNILINDSIDLEMYETSEKKDVLMKQIENIVKISSFDCPLTIERNKNQGDDYSRECDYTKCEYTCKGAIDPIIDSSTYNLYHIVIQIVQTSLEKYFRSHFFAKIEEIQDRLPQLEQFEVVNAVNTIINKNIQFINKYGHPSYLRIQNNIIFISSDPKISNNDNFTEFYSKNLIIQNGDPFSQIVKEIYDMHIPTVIQTIFDKPEYLRNTIVTLPEIVQRIILEGCIVAEDRQIEKNKDTRKKILNFYRAFYDKVALTVPRPINQPSTSKAVKTQSVWIIWLYQEKIGVVCYENNEWVDCKSKHSDLLESHITKKRLHFTQSPVGFYGLYNPQLEDFCIRDVRNLKVETDLRKITVGRRCHDWDQSTLLDLAVRKMKIPIPNIDFMSKATSNQLKELVKKTKYAKLPEDLVDDETMRRFLYWKKIKRVHLCDNIKKWFEENDLIEENFDCGTQKKQRLKFGI